MEMRRIGQLTVSVVGVGCNQFGPTCDARRTREIVDAALEAGINFFDTADEYGPEGVSEEYLGRAVRERRDQVVIATKFGHHMHGDPERGGAGALWIGQAVEDSLRRLGTDRIDLYQQHFPDPATPPGETLEALDSLVQSGKVLEYGFCNLGAADIDERAELAANLGLHPPASAQNRLNLLRQQAREDLVPTLERRGMALLPFFPLASGMLTGKYRPGRPLPPNSRFARHLEPAQAAHMVERDADRVAALESWAAARGHTIAELAIAWLASQPVVASVIAGATSPEQVRDNASAGRWVLTEAEIESAAVPG